MFCFLCAYIYKVFRLQVQYYIFVFIILLFIGTTHEGIPNKIGKEESQVRMAIFSFFLFKLS